MAKAGDFELSVRCGGHPIWFELKYNGKQLPSFSHFEVSDLEYVLKKAKAEAMAVLPETRRHEVG